MKQINRYPLIATLALGVAALSACAERPDAEEELSERDGYQAPTVDVKPEGRGPDAEDRVLMTARFEPAEGARAGQNVHGTVSVFEATDPSGDYKLAVRIEGLTEGEHAWHIHSAPCGKEAPVVVAFTDTNDATGLAQPLIPGESRVAEATVTVPKDKLSVDQLRSGDYSLHVHERGGLDFGATMACASL